MLRTGAIQLLGYFTMMAKKAPNPTDKHVGARVRMRRMQLGMSQSKLGDALELTFQQIQKYEKGANRIGASRLQQISNVLQVTPAFFFEGQADHRVASLGGVATASSSVVSEVLATKDGLHLVMAFHSIADTKLRHRIVALVQQISAGP